MTGVHPEPGLRIAERYELTTRIATGGMGEVWRARDEVLGREVAVKLLRREYADDEAFLTRFRGEARHAASLSHPGIAAVFDYGETDGTAYLVMELVPGEPLSDRLSRDGALPLAVAVPLLQQAADALQAAHAGGLVHRDIKPGNLMITPDERVKVTDFGIARAADQLPITRTGEVMGTAQYLSPEQALGQSATAASDVYALGVVAYEALSGRRPFDAETPVATALAHVNTPPDPLPATVPAGVAAVVTAALAKAPADRPATAAAFGTALGAAAAGQPAGLLAAGSAATTQLIEPPVGATAVLPVAPASLTPPTDRAAGSSATRGSRAVVVAGVLAILAVVLVVAIALSQRAGQTSSGATSGPAASPTQSSTSTSPGATSITSQSTTQTPATATTATTPAAITLDPADFVGRPAREVTRELEAMGLSVKTETTGQGDGVKGDVVGLSPTANLRGGDTVVLQVLGPPKTGGGGKGDD